MDKSFPPPRPRPDAPSPKRADDAPAPAKIPTGVVIGPDGKPCRTCTPFAAWAAAMKTPLPPGSASSSSSSSSAAPSSSATSTSSMACPPDIAELGAHSWTLLHSIGATYPETASAQQQREMRQFLRLFAGLYPCGMCGDDFAAWMEARGNEPRVGGREGLGRWLCEAHNEVNRKTGKELFDCARWEERWRTGGEGC